MYCDRFFLSVVKKKDGGIIMTEMKASENLGLDVQSMIKLTEC